MLFALMLISALADAISVGAVVPFLAVLAIPEKVLQHPGLAGLANVLGITATKDLILPLTLAFGFAALAAAGIRIVLLRASVGFAFGSGADFSIEAYRRALYQPYPVHLNRNSSEVVTAIVQKVGVATHALLSMLILTSSAVLFACILLTLFLIDSSLTIAAAVGLGTAYLLVSALSRRRLERNSRRIAEEQIHVIKALQEGLGGIRDVLLNGTQSAYCDVYRNADQPLRKALADNLLVGAQPRHIMEAIGLVLIAALAYASSFQPGGVQGAIPVLGALALGAQRALPALQQLYASWTNITGSAASVSDVLDLLEQPLPPEAGKPAPAALSFQDEIRFESVSYRYRPEGPWIIDNLNISIRKGSRIGFVGITGSGKSTALDLLMFLLEPTQGQILVDGRPVTGESRRAWQQIIAHVPQSIYLADSTVAENIAFGFAPGEIDLERVKQAARQAQIAGFVESQPAGYETLVGERGIRLSGGERQRIGIARALYKRAAIIVFDEATSALDDATEHAAMEAIQNLQRDLTILIIAHRLSTVQRCDTIVQLERGRVVAQGSYKDLAEIRQGLQRSA